ncbi:MAG TPA: hypothetical protein VNT76_22715, partial [Candidatus Binatus sp.]|nr:hypothetical protein [Candidatus Binatus sp.]
MKQFWILVYDVAFGSSIGRSKKKTAMGLALAILLLILSSPAHAQQPANFPRIGYLSSDSPST